ncbi:MAG: hypothetical protein HY560_05660 [Gemmatimonadetes bacterium]|nr:hypothetical protein [Gemmatimonadota bacterium]
MHWRNHGPLATLSSLLVVPGIVLISASPAAAPRTAGAACTAGLGVEVVKLEPTGKLATAAGTIELKPVMSPFGVGITVDGRYLYDATVTVQNLPDPSSLGPYTTYVVWLATPSLDKLRNLGPITPGTSLTARVDFIKMMYMVTAEANAKGEKWAGPILLVGRSSSARVQNLAGCDIYDEQNRMGG